jgi:hypothetical protein
MYIQRSGNLGTNRLMYGTDSGMCPLASFAISGVEHLGSTARELIVFV